MVECATIRCCRRLLWPLSYVPSAVERSVTSHCLSPTTTTATTFTHRCFIKSIKLPTKADGIVSLPRMRLQPSQYRSCRVDFWMQFSKESHPPMKKGSLVAFAPLLTVKPILRSAEAAARCGFIKNVGAREKKSQTKWLRIERTINGR